MIHRRGILQFGTFLLLASAILLAAFLLLDALGVTGSPLILTHPWLRIVYLISISLGPLLALILAGLIFYLAQVDRNPGLRLKKATRIFLGTLLVLGVAAVIFRHGILVKATSRAPEDHFPILGVLLSIGIGLLFLKSRMGNKRRFGAGFLAVVPVLIIQAYGLGLRQDPHAIIEARANHIGQAIERFRLDTGAYPAELKDLEPGYLPILLGPLTGRGQDWCYQAGTDYYRLGYVLYERYHQYLDDTPFWEPYLEIRIPAFAGKPPEGHWVCDVELERMKQGEGYVNTDIWVDMIQQGEGDG